MKGFKKLIISTLVACMTMVTPVSFGMTNVSAAKTNKTEMSVYSIDAGRKFFSVNQIKEIIDTANETGFTHVQLMFGNDGLRLVLDDMTIKANGKTYASDDVKTAIENGTKEYYDDPNGTVLNQKDMESILKYAKEKNVKIIPVISSPGHMDAILNTMEGLGIENSKFDYQGTTSKTTIDLENKEAVTFTKALVEKYIKYFNGKVEYFNFGADEYANDATYHGPSKKSGFLVLQEEGLYDDFINYINEISSIIKENNMKPICFNDGIYYNNVEENGTVDKDIIVAYWTPGFERYTPASAKFLIEKGHKILNTNDNWYYVVGRNGEGWWYGSAMATEGMKKNKFTRVVGTSEDEKLPIIGSMACTWADEPHKTYKPDIVKDLMKLFAEQNPEYVYRKANYDIVEEAKAKLPKDLSKYTEESIYNLNKALANVVYGERLEDQSKVDAMANNITKAISELKVETKKKKKSAVFSIDAGRKYFSKEQLMQIIKKASENGYTDVQLILGNDGLRFALDNMRISVNGKTYKSESVKKAITKGNDEYYKDPNGDYLTESEMDEILAYAKKLKIGIIPVINSPGHMDGILNAMEELGINNPQYSYKGKKSTRTIDLNNKEAVEFNKELVKKYVKYFSKYSKVFNFGCDEYANDIDSSEDGYYNGWSRLQGTGMYPEFVKYVNDISKIIKDAGMRPMCFNDGIYYNNNDKYGEFDKDIIISYWTAGWWEFYVAKASYLYEKGHDILNLNDGWYWVLGNIDGKIDGNSVQYPYVNAVKNIDTIDFNKVAGDSLSVPTIGSVQAVWCDVPSVEHDMDRIMNLMDLYSNKNLSKPNDGNEPDKGDKPDKEEKPNIEADRIQGANRVETAIEASKELYKTSANAVVLANAERYTDILAASPFAVQEEAPILFTYKDKLPESTLKEIERLGTKKVYISGGYSAVSKKIVDTLKSKGYDVVRFDGADRYDTAKKIAEKMREKGNTKVVELVSGENYPDAVSMTSMAVKDNAPILLTKKDSLPKYTKEALAKWDVETVKIAGLDKAVSKNVEKELKEGFKTVKDAKDKNKIYPGAKEIVRFGGSDRYETSKIIAAESFPESEKGVYVTGENFPDALVAGSYAGKNKAPILLVKKDKLPQSVKNYTENSKINNITVIGGKMAVSEKVFDLLKEAIR